MALSGRALAHAEHLKRFHRKFYRELVKKGELEQYAEEVARQALLEEAELLEQGVSWIGAQELLRETLYPAPGS